MKKKLLLIVLSLAILTSLTAGTLAVYTKTLGDVEEITAKRFAFSLSGQVQGESSAIKLAPTESMEYDFVIANSERGWPQCRVALVYDITVDISAAKTQMLGLTATLLDGEEELATTGADGTLAYQTKSAADEDYAKTYRVIVKWENADNSSQTAEGSAPETYTNGLKLTVQATQDTSAS